MGESGSRVKWSTDMGVVMVGRAGIGLGLLAVCCSIVDSGSELKCPGTLFK